jgi:hypothetical protein
MKYLITLVFLLTLPIAKAQLSSNEKKEGWQLLFNGKNLDGWNQKNGEARYEVKNGEIIGTSITGTPNSFLCTNKNYGDFVLELDLRVEGDINSGVQFRSLSTPEFQNGRVHGYQAEVDPSKRGWSGGIYDEGRREWLSFPEGNPAAQKAFKPNDWNHYRIEAIGNTIRTWVNGVPVSHVIDDLTPSGFIALQVHSISNKADEGKQIRWKNIKIKTENLTPSPWDDTPVVNLLHNNLSEQEKAQGFEFIFNGKDFSGWRSAGKQEMRLQRWSIKDGILTIRKSDGSEPGNDIVTQEEYGPIELKFDFKITEGANSGIKYFVNENPGQRGAGILGLEYQILDDERHPDAKGGVVGNRTLGSLYDLIPSIKPDKRFKRAIGEWNQGRIIIYPDNTVQHWLNGFKVIEYQRKSNIYKALVARSKYQNFEGFGEVDKGPILLQDHSDEVHFRNLKIRKL